MISGASDSFIGTNGSTPLRFGTAFTERMRLDSSGRLGLGTSTPDSYNAAGDNLVIYENGNSGITIASSTTGAGSIFFADGTSGDAQYKGSIQYIHNDDKLYLGAAAGTAITIDSSNRVGIGTTDPGSYGYFAVRGFAALGGSYGNISAHFSDGATTSLFIKHAAGEIGYFTDGAVAQTFYTSSSERVRIDSSGRLLVGTSSGLATFASQIGQFQVAQTSTVPNTSLFRFTGDAGGPNLYLNKSRGTSIGTNTIVQNNDALGGIFFAGADGSGYSIGASISVNVDGTPGANDMPGRLVFSTTADGASSPTERMRISAAGAASFGTTSNSPAFANVQGIVADGPNGYLASSRVSGSSASFNRKTDDGTIVDLMQDGTVEGAISVSGTTVTYGGGHLARWSQLPNEEDPSDILKGTVMSNLDEMCEWGEEDNEQLNKTKVSDIEGDPNVAGVFVSTSFSDDGPLDYFCAMTGDMIIRIAEDVTVQRGDLLMSAGDGTAKPQDDDIIRSKTIAKVTSTHVTCTYDDGSYCVPCVLMAC
jgi:hypothetical protein